VLYRKEGEKWILSEPRKQQINDTQNQSVEGSLASVRNLRADRFYDGEVPEGFTPEQGKIILRTGEKERILTIGGTRNGQRLVRVNDRPVVAVSKDPVRLLNDLPDKPSGWPTVQQNADEADGPRKDLPERIRQMKPGGTSGSR
jgi:hypothetical protein